MKKLTYRQLKDFINRISEIHLDEPVLIYEEEKAIHIEAAQIISEPITEVENGDLQRYIELKSEVDFMIEQDIDDLEIIRQIEPGFPMLFSDVNSTYLSKCVEFSIETPEE